MLFVSLLQGFGFLPKRNDSTADVAPKVPSVVAKAKASVRVAAKQGI